MKSSLSLRSAQKSATANTTTRTRAFGPATYFRAALLGVFAVASTSGAAMAQEAPSVKAMQADAQHLYLTIENPEQKVLYMQVVNLDKKTCIMQEANRQPSYGCQLNFQKLPAGQYAVLLRVGRERYRYNVQVQNQTETNILVSGITATAAHAVASGAQ